MNFSFWPFLWFGLLGRLPKVVSAMHISLHKSLVSVPSRALTSRDSHRGGGAKVHRIIASQTCIARFGELSAQATHPEPQRIDCAENLQFCVCCQMIFDFVGLQKRNCLLCTFKENFQDMKFQTLFVAVNQAVLHGVPFTGVQVFKVEKAHVAAQKKGPENRKKWSKIAPPLCRPLKHSMSQFLKGRQMHCDEIFRKRPWSTKLLQKQFAWEVFVSL